MAAAERNNGNQIANTFSNKDVRCIRKEPNGTVTVKYLSPFIIQYEYVMLQTGFVADDPRYKEKMEAAGYRVKPDITDVTSETENKTQEEPQAKEPVQHSSLIERFDISDDGIPKKKRKRIQKIKIHHAD